MTMAQQPEYEQAMLGKPDAMTASSMSKQLAYTDYAEGKISADELVGRIADIQPPQPPVSRSRKLMIAFSALFVALLIPAWARRDD